MSLCLESLLVQLDESKSWIFEEAFRAFSLEEIQRALDAAFAIEQDGGERVADGKRMRTVGGIFLRVLREHHPQKMGHILKEQTSLRRKEAAARAQRFVARKYEKKPDDIHCPAEVVGQIIGKCGMVINKFRRDSGCRITLNAKLGTIRVEGQEDKARKCRAQLQEEVRKLVRATHGDYYDQVLMSDFMCKKAATQEPWAALLKQWILEGVENTPASAMPRLLAALVVQAPKDHVQEIEARLEEQPDLFDSAFLRDAVLAAVRNPCAPDRQQAGFDPAELLAAGYDDDEVWIAPDGERFTKAKFLEEVGDEDLWQHEMGVQEAASTATAATPCNEAEAPADEAMTPAQEEKPEAEQLETPEAKGAAKPDALPSLGLGPETPLKDAQSPKLTLAKKKKGLAFGAKPCKENQEPEQGPVRVATPPGNVLELAQKFDGVVRRTTPPPRPISTVD